MIPMNSLHFLAYTTLHHTADMDRLVFGFRFGILAFLWYVIQKHGVRGDGV
jgi:hypothetical protein